MGRGPVHLEALARRLYGGSNRICWQPAQVATIVAKFGFGAADIDLRELGAGGYHPAEVAPMILDATSDDGRSITATISTSDVDRHGDMIPLSAWRYSNFVNTNPVVLFGHDASLVPIGRALRVWIDGQRLRSTFQLAPFDVNPFAERVRKLIDGKYLNAVSVGFLPLSFKFSSDPARPYGIDFLSVELLEFSVCAIPAAPRALIEHGQNSSGKELSPAQRRRQREVDLIRMRG